MIIEGPGKNIEVPDDFTPEKIQQAIETVWPRPEATTGEIVKAGLKSMPIQAARQGVGLVKGAIGAVAGETPEALDVASDYWNDKLAETAGRLHLRDRSGKWYLHQGLQSIAAGAPALGLGLVNPVAGAVTSAAGVAGMSYLDYEDQVGPRKAAAAAIPAGLAEGVFSLPFFRIFKEGPAKNALMTWIRRVAQAQTLKEIGTEGIQAAIDKTVAQEGTVGDFVKELPQLGLDTAAITAIQTAILLPLGLGVHGAKRVFQAKWGHDQALTDIQKKLLEKPVPEEIPSSPKPVLPEVRAGLEAQLKVAPGTLTDEQLKAAAEKAIAEGALIPEEGSKEPVGEEVPLVEAAKSNPENKAVPAEKPPVDVDGQTAEAAVQAEIPKVKEKKAKKAKAQASTTTITPTPETPAPAIPVPDEKSVTGEPLVLSPEANAADTAVATYEESTGKKAEAFKPVAEEWSTDKPRLMPRTTYKEIKKAHETKMSEIMQWLMGKGNYPKSPTSLYRGIPRGSKPERGSEYTHASPWLINAAKGGKGAFGDYENYDIYEYPAGYFHKYYRGGSLAGDPLESTRIKSHEGMRWDTILRETKKSYNERVTELMNERFPDSVPTQEEKKQIMETAAMKAADDLVRGSLETDIDNKRGVWWNQQMHPELNQETPRLRNNKRLAAVIRAAVIRGKSLSDVPGMPEHRILMRSEAGQKLIAQALRGVFPKAKTTEELRSNPIKSYEEMDPEEKKEADAALQRHGYRWNDSTKKFEFTEEEKLISGAEGEVPESRDYLLHRILKRSKFATALQRAKVRFNHHLAKYIPGVTGISYGKKASDSPGEPFYQPEFTYDDLIVRIKTGEPIPQREIAQWIMDSTKDEATHHILKRIFNAIPEDGKVVCVSRVPDDTWNLLPFPDHRFMVMMGELGWNDSKRGLIVMADGRKELKSQDDRDYIKVAMVHELVHAATIPYLNRIMDYTDDHLTPEEVVIRDSFESLLKVVRDAVINSNLKKDDKESLLNGNFHTVQEMVAAGMTNFHVREFMKGIKAEGDQSVWSKFVDLVARIFGITERNAFTKLMELTDNLLDVNKIESLDNMAESIVQENALTVTENSLGTPSQEVVDTTEEEAQKVKPEEPAPVKKAKRKRAQKKAKAEDASKEVGEVQEVVSAEESAKVKKMKQEAGKAEKGSATHRVQNNYAEYYMDPQETATDIARRPMTMERVLESRDFYSLVAWLNARVNQYFHTGQGDMAQVNNAVARLFKDAKAGNLEEEQVTHLEEFAKFTKDVVLAREEQKELGVQPEQKTTATPETAASEQEAATAQSEANIAEESPTTIDEEMKVVQSLIDMAYNELMEKRIEIKNLEAGEAAGGKPKTKHKKYLANECEELWDQITELENKLDDLKFEKATSSLDAIHINDELKKARTKLKNRLFRSEIEENNITVLHEKKDIPLWYEWLHSPLQALKDFKDAQALVRKGQEAFMQWKWQVHTFVKRSEILRSLLDEGQRKELTEMARAIQRGEQATSADPKVRTVYARLRELFNETQEHARDYYRLVLRQSLKPDELKAFNLMVDSGQDPVLIGLLMKIDPRILQELKERYDKIGEWGIENFVTNMELGSLRVVELSQDKGGKTKQKTIAYAPTKSIAVRKIMERVQAAEAAGEDVPNLAIDISPVFDDSMLVEMGKKRYNTTVGKISSALKKEVEEVNKELVSSKVRNVLEKVITVKPNLVYAGPFQERQDILEGEKDIFDVLPAYFNAMYKKINLDPYILEAREFINQDDTPRNVQLLIENHIKDMKSTYGWLDRFVDETLSRLYTKTGWKVFDRESGQYSKAVAEARKITADLKLGYRPVTSFINMASGLINTNTMVPTKLFTQAFKYMKTEEGKDLIERNRPYLGEGFAVGEAGELLADIPKWHPLWFHQLPEAFNREHCFCANYLFGKAQGMDEEAAVHYARGGVWAQQFVYSIAALPKIMRGPTSRLLTQFKPYLIKQLELFTNMTVGEKVKFISAQLMLGGPRALLSTIRSVPLLGLFVGWDEIDEWLNKNYPHLYRGVPGSLGPMSVDVSAQAAFQFPQQPMDWLGPMVSDIFRLHSRVLGPILAGRAENVLPFEQLKHPLEAGLNYKELRRQEIFRWIRDGIPAMYYWDQVLSYAFDDDGWILDDFGKRKYKPENSWIDIAKLVSGAKPMEESAWEVSERRHMKEQEKFREDKQMLTATVLDTIESGGSLDGDIVEKCKELGVTYQSLQEAAKSRKLTPYHRRVLATQLVGRPAALRNLYHPEQ